MSKEKAWWGLVGVGLVLVTAGYLGLGNEPEVVVLDDGGEQRTEALALATHRAQDRQDIASIVSTQEAIRDGEGGLVEYLRQNWA